METRCRRVPRDLPSGLFSSTKIFHRWRRNARVAILFRGDRGRATNVQIFPQGARGHEVAETGDERRADDDGHRLLDTGRGCVGVDPGANFKSAVGR